MARSRLASAWGRIAAVFVAAALLLECPLHLSAGSLEAVTPLAAGPEISGQEPASRIPLVIIMEPWDSEEVSAVRDVIPGPLLRRLEDAGYVPEESLFAIRPSAFEDIPAASALVSSFVRRVTEASSPGLVDVIACGASALVARLSLEAGLIPDGDVRNLIMVASPNRGAFVADMLKSAVELAKHESILEKETRSWRFLPAAEELLARPSTSQFVGAATRTSGGAGLALTADSVWEDETTWISRRVRQVYEPLYAKYVQERFLALPYVPAESHEETFAGWIRRTMPDFWEATVSRAVSPPLGEPAAGPPDSDGILSVPPPGGDLSAAYYEILSMEVARNQYVMRLASKGSLIESLFKEPYVPHGWKDALLYYGMRALQYYARKALITLKSEVQKVVVEGIVGWTGFLRDSSSPILRRVMKEDLLVNLGTSSDVRFERLPVNAYLASQNALSLSRSASRKTRYVSIAAHLANPWSLVWPELAPNDLFLEVDSAIAPVGLEDLVYVVSGVVSPSREGLLGDKRVQDYILRLIHPGGEAAEVRTAVRFREPVTIRVSSWAPSHAVLPAEAGFSAQSVTVSLPDPPVGWQYRVWIEGTVLQDAGPDDVASLKEGGSFQYRAGGGKVLGLRLVRSGPLNPVMGTSVSSAYSDEVCVEAVLELVSLEAGGGGQASSGEKLEIVDGEGGTPETGAPVDQEPSAGSGSDFAYPLIRMVNRSKRTTHREPKEIYHEYWLLDFGDGTTQRIDGNCSLSVSHTFPKAGQYEAVAESYCGDRKLLERKWAISVTGQDGLTRTFNCASVPRAQVRLVLDGPIMWVTGKPAVYTASFDIEAPDNVEVASVRFDPGPKFAVVWERAGEFHVTCAASVALRYFLEDGTITVENTYVYDVLVQVLTTGVTQ